MQSKNRHIQFIYVDKFWHICLPKLRTNFVEVYPEFCGDFDIHKPKFTRSLPAVCPNFKSMKVEVSTYGLHKHTVFAQHPRRKLRLRYLQTSTYNSKLFASFEFRSCDETSDKLRRLVRRNSGETRRKLGTNFGQTAANKRRSVTKVRQNFGIRAAANISTQTHFCLCR